MVRRVAAVEGDEMVSDDAEDEGFRIPQVGFHVCMYCHKWGCLFVLHPAAGEDLITQSAAQAHLGKALVRNLDCFSSSSAAALGCRSKTA